VFLTIQKIVSHIQGAGFEMTIWDWPSGQSGDALAIYYYRVVL